MVCIKECPIFKIDLKRLQSDEEVYLKRCMNNSKNETTYNLSNNIQVIISVYSIEWYKDGEVHRDNDQPALIWESGRQCWYKNGKQHRDNNKPAIIWADGNKLWYKNGVQYELVMQRRKEPKITRYDIIRLNTKWGGQNNELV